MDKNFIGLLLFLLLFYVIKWIKFYFQNRHIPNEPKVATCLKSI